MPATISVNFASQAAANAGTSSNTVISPALLAGVLANAGGSGSGYVTIAGTQTITGAKTFSSIITGNAGVNVANGQAYQLGGVSRLYGATQDSYANIRVCQNLSSTLQDGMYINYNSTGGNAAHCRIYANGTNLRMIARADNGRVGVNTDAPVTNFDVNGTATAHVFNAGLNSGAFGRCTISRGNASNAGYVEWFKPNGQRLAYMGFGNNNNLTVNMDLGGAFYMAGGPVYTNNNIFINNGAPTLYLQHTGARSAMIHCNSNLLYFLRGGNNSVSWNTLSNGRWPLIVNLNNGNLSVGSDSIDDATGPRYPLRAWALVNAINPAGWSGAARSAPIRASKGVSSATIVSIGGFGICLINFSAPMPDTNYCATSMGKYSPGVGYITYEEGRIWNTYPRTTTRISINMSSTAAQGWTDYLSVMVAR